MQAIFKCADGVVSKEEVEYLWLNELIKITWRPRGRVGLKVLNRLYVGGVLFCTGG